jgi:flagellar basal-body rod protein FlgB
VSGGIVDVLQFAIDGVNDQINATANNLSNEATPGYSATDVDFQSSLDQALNANGTATATVTTTPSTAAPNTQGNNVSMSDELVGSEKEALEYQQLSESLNAQFRLVRGVVGGGWQ